MDYDLGLSRIYELVINSDPCYAFLLDNNTLVQNKLVSAHVLAHCDFFKNNAMFSNTARNVVNSMAASAERFREYEMEHGKEAVEQVLDAALAIQEHVDASRTALRRQRLRDQKIEASEETPKTSPFEDMFALDERLRVLSGEPVVVPSQSSKLTEMELNKDLVLFLINHSKVLDDWQRDILTVIREEMLYFWPQVETKIMNEGWPSYRKDA